MLPAIHAGQDAKFLFECLNECVGIGKTTVSRYILNDMICVQQLIYGMIQSNLGQVIEKSHAELLVKEFGEIWRGKMHHFRQLRQGKILRMMLPNKPGDLCNTGSMAVALDIPGMGVVYTEIVVHHIHQFIDICPVAQLIALLLISIVLYDSGHQGANGLKCCVVPLYGAVAEELGVLGVGKRLLKQGLFKLNTHQGAVRTAQFMGGMAVDGNHILWPKGIGVSIYNHCTAAAQDEINLEIIVHMILYIANLLHGTAQRHMGIEIRNFIISAHRIVPPYDPIIRCVD